MLGVDALTHALPRLISALKGKSSILAFESKGEYKEDRSYTKVFVDTTMTEGALEDWLFSLKGVEIVGAFTRKNYYKKDGYLWEVLDATPLPEGAGK
jgi:hypothetical protein